MKEEIIRTTAEKLINAIGMPEEYIPEYFDSVMTDVEVCFDDEIDPITFATNFIESYAGDLELVEEVEFIYRQGIKEYNENYEESTWGLHEEVRRDYNPKYNAGDKGPFDEIYKTANGPGTQSASKKSKINGKPHFKFDDGGYGPIPTTGVGRSDYNVKYGGSLLTEGKLKEFNTLENNTDDDDFWPENLTGLLNKWFDKNIDQDLDLYDTDELYFWIEKAKKRFPKYSIEQIESVLESWVSNKSLTERKSPKIPKFISPALKEAIKTWETKKHLFENKIVDLEDSDLLND
jgi:hypothetical protein